MIAEPNRRWSRPGAFTRRTAVATEIEVSRFVGDLVHMLAPQVVVETGTHLAGTAIEIARALLDNAVRGVPGTLYTFETDPEVHARAVELLSPFAAVSPRVVVPVLGTVHMLRPGLKVGLAFIDSDWHTRAADLSVLEDMMLPYGIIAVHDTLHEDQMRALIDALGAEGWDTIDLPTPRGLTLAQRHDWRGQ